MEKDILEFEAKPKKLKLTDSESKLSQPTKFFFSKGNNNIEIVTSKSFILIYNYHFHKFISALL